MTDVEELKYLDVHAVKVSGFLDVIGCICIPRFQRHYDWTVELAHSLARDTVVAERSNPSDPEHWIGVLIWQKASTSSSNRCEKAGKLGHDCCEIVDGQQRLATLKLWAQALKFHGQTLSPAVDLDLGILGKRPLYLQKQDAEVYTRVKAGDDVSSDPGQIAQIYTYFRYLLWLGGDSLVAQDPSVAPDRRMGGTLDEKFEKLLERQKKKKEDSGLRSIPHSDIQGLLNAAVDRLSIVSINVLDDSDDVVAEVFDALNGKRLELSQFDHLRNHCFRKIDVGVRDKVYDDHWVPAEKNIFGVGSVKRPADHFLYNYLISVGEGARSQFNQRRAFGAFRRYERSAMRSSVEKWISGELGDAVSRWRFALHPVGKLKARGRDIKLNDVSRAAMARIRMVSEGPPLPLVMVMLDRVSRLDPKSDPESITTREFKKLVIALEGCLFKTRLAGDSLTNLRADVMKRLPALLREWKSDPVEGKSAGDKMFEWIQEKSPPWSQVESFMTSDWKHHPPSKPQGAYSLLLSGPSLALFDALEEQKSGAGGSALFHRYTDPLSKANESDAPFWVEHLYPQKPHNDWSADLATWKCDESEMRKQLHRLGNLAPIGASLNRKMRNKRFSSKTDDAKDPKMPRLKVNGGWEKSKSWTTKQINQREKFLLKIMKERWPE